MKKIVTYNSKNSTVSDLAKQELQALVDDELIVWENYDVEDNIVDFAALGIKTYPTYHFIWNNTDIISVVQGFIPIDRILEFNEATREVPHD
jgi:hypothetical protein